MQILSTASSTGCIHAGVHPDGPTRSRNLVCCGAIGWKTCRFIYFWWCFAWTCTLFTII